MLTQWLIDNVLMLFPELIFGFLGFLPFVEIAFGEFFTTFIGYGCYICGVGVMDALFISIFGWCSVFTILGIFKFVKQYVPMV